ncbi:MAG: hypothetical protein KAR00_01290 [Candidatus Pacebacteria bacterium]|nr:hypothetical protein [Candidatus Paceibacterota bacterium]
MSEIQNIIKNIQNIMRKDAEVVGDAQRQTPLLTQLKNCGRARRFACLPAFGGMFKAKYKL